MPEVSHRFHTFAVSVAGDSGGVSDEAHEIGLLAVEGLKDNGRAAALGELAELVKLLAEIITGIHGVWHARFLAIEGGNHDDTGGSELTSSLDDLAHGGVELILHGRILCENEPAETCANG